jgi:hypothetical protein
MSTGVKASFYGKRVAGSPMGESFARREKRRQFVRLDMD